jgi:hypothetical protein
VDQVSQSGVVKDLGGGIADVKEHLVESAVGKITVDQLAQLLGVAERRQRAVDQADDLAEINVGGVAA